MYYAKVSLLVYPLRSKQIMNTKKKLMISIIIVAVALALAITGIVVVLVATSQSSTSRINMQYTVSGVGVRVSANGIVGTTSYPLKDGSKAYIDLTPSHTSGTLNQTDSVLSLSADNPRIVYEYMFTNLTDTDVEIALSNVPATKTNVELYYSYSDTKVSDLNSLDLFESFENKCLGRGAGTSKYIYITVQVADTMADSKFEGSFSWSLSKAENVVAVHYSQLIDLSFSSSDIHLPEYGKHLLTYYLPTEKIYEPSFDMYDDFYFYGWCYLPNPTTAGFDVRIPFPVNAIDLNLYCRVMGDSYLIEGIYLPGNVPSDYYVLQDDGTYAIIYYHSGFDENGNTVATQTALTNSTLIIPDMYNGKPVTKVDTYGNQESSGQYPNYTTGTSLLMTYDITTCYVGNNVTYLGNFSNHASYENMVSVTNTTLQYVELGRNMTSLNGNALARCSNLSTIKFFDKLEEITECCYYEGSTAYISGLAGTPVYNNNVTVACANNSEKYILVNGTGYTNTSSIYNYDKVICIPSFAFTAVDYSDIYNGNISYTSVLQSATIPTGVKRISDYAFYMCNKLNNVTMHNNLIEIGYYAFYECTSLSSAINLPNVEKIYSYAFYNCNSLTTVTTGKNLRYIGYNAFYYSGITGFEFKTGYMDYLGTRAFGYSGLRNVYNIPAIKEIGEAVFVTCTQLTSVTIPEGLTRISDTMFNECYSLKQIVIPRSVTTIDNYAFVGCTALEKVVIPSSVISIGEWAFYNCTNLKTCNIPDSVTTIGIYAFYGCVKLQSITLPRDLTSIGDKAFKNCTGVTKFYYNALNSALFSHGNETFYYLGQSVTGVQMIIDKDVTSVAGFMFGGLGENHNAKITEVVFEDGSKCTRIDDFAFYNCTSLTTLLLSDRIEYIDAYAFCGCSIQSLTLPSNCESVGDMSFVGASITNLVIPKSVSYIGYCAFSDCDALTSVIFEDSDSTWLNANDNSAVFTPESSSELNAIFLVSGLSQYSIIKSAN